MLKFFYGGQRWYDSCFNPLLNFSFPRFFDYRWVADIERKFSDPILLFKMKQRNTKKLLTYLCLVLSSRLIELFYVCLLIADDFLAYLSAILKNERY